MTAEHSPALPYLPARQADSHKGDYGRALLVGGSRGMSGAVSLAGMAALRSGAGLVTLGVPQQCLSIVAGFEPCYMTVPLADDSQGQISMAGWPALAELAGRATCISLGPGLGRSTDLTQLTWELYRSAEVPLICDADALFALAQRTGRLEDHRGPRILTPHPGEFRRLVGRDFDSRDQAEQWARQLAAEADVVIVLKGHRTLVCNDQTDWHNTTGNPGMATGGSGDVLTGILTALVCQGLEPLQAAIAGVYVHGTAGDLAAQQLGQVAMIARDIIDYLPSALRTITTPA